MKIAVTGPNGQLGRELVKQGAIPINGLLMSQEMTANIEAIKPGTIINCAALTDVDYCERHIHQASIVNASGVQYLSDTFGGYLIQISTDYVFDGRDGPYGVRDAPNPINIYGWSKLGGELAIKQHAALSLIVRTTILFSSANNNFVAKIVSQLRRGGIINMYNPDITGSPTYVPALATEIMRVIEAKYCGIVHIAGTQSVATSRLNFARDIAKIFNYDPSLIVGNHNYIDAAPRPRHAGLICDHSEYGMINSHAWLDGLTELSKQEDIYREQSMERVDTGRSGTDQ